MATIKPTLSITANAASATNSPGPLTMALALSASQTLTVDNVDQFTSSVRTTNDATGYDKIGYEVGFDRQTLIDGSDSAHDAAAAKSDGTTLVSKKALLSKGPTFVKKPNPGTPANAPIPLKTKEPNLLLFPYSVVLGTTVSL